jgi:Rad3-related DNA helicase
MEQTGQRMTQDSPTHTSQLDEFLQDLREIEEQLGAASGDFDETIRLREQQRELRAAAARLAQRARTPNEISRELEHLKRLRHELLSGHVSVGHVGGGNGPGGGGIEPRDVFAMNEAIDDAWDRDELESRIQKLEAQLENSG